MSDVLIRVPTEADVAAGAALTSRAWEVTYRGMIPDEALDEWIAGTDEGWRSLVSAAGDAPERAWVAERMGRLVGFATTSPAKDEWLPSPPGAGELRNLYLDPDAIGSGVGRKLFEHAVDDLRRRRFAPLIVWAFRDNERGCAFYERMGLTRDAGTDWILAGVPCPIVRFRGDWPDLERG